MGTNKLRLGIFGVGHLGKYHIENWQKIEEIEIIGFFDPNNEIAEAVTTKYGIKRFENDTELMELVDVVDIITPTQFHFDLCKKAVKLHKHVFVEKPMVSTPQEALEIVQLVEEAQVKFQVGHVERFNPAFLAIKHLKLNPMFIEVHRLAEFNPRGTEVSVIFDLMIHDLDIVLSIVKSPIKFISASGVNVITETPDIANVRLEFTNGCVANITSSRISMKKMRKMRLFQKDAYIGLDFLTKKTEIIKQKTETDKDGFTFPLKMQNGDEKMLFVANPTITDGNAIEAELRSFTAAIINNTTTEVSEMDGLLSVQVAHQILDKMKQTESVH
jgi:predicted dehydrogenase